MNDKYKEIPFFCIHLLSETNRESAILALKEGLQCPMKIVEAINGTAFLQTYPNFPRRHPFETLAKERGIPDKGQFISNPGEVGCLLSHISILYHAEQKGYPFIGIFEDDAEFHTTLPHLNAFLENVEKLPQQWDFLILGANEWVQSFPVDSELHQIQRFWGTHALLLSRKAIQAILATHKQLQMEGFAYPADWLYAKSIQEHKLTVYGPTQPKSLFRQVPGFVSAINGKVRQ